MTPFDITPRQPDDPGVRIIPLHRMSVPVRQGGHAPGSPVDMIERLRERLNDKPRMVEVKPTWRDDLAELIDEIRAAPLSHAAVGVAGFIAGTAGILVLAEIMVRVL